MFFLLTKNVSWIKIVCGPHINHNEIKTKDIFLVLIFSKCRKPATATILLMGSAEMEEIRLRTELRPSREDQSLKDIRSRF